jgi:hypothetical protein
MKDIYKGISHDKIAHYTSLKVSQPITIDGNLDKPVWQAAQKSRRFVDLVSGEPGFFDTRMASLWDDKNLYVAFWIEEPLVRASFTERDSLVWFDNDVEIFIDGEDCYYEFELNAFNTIYEAFFIYQDALKKGSRFDIPQFDLYTRDVDVLCGFQDGSRYHQHPRGKRWAFMDYDFPGLQTAVKIDGKINDSTHIDKGWTVELAFPWKGIEQMFAKRSFPPKEGETLRAAFFRFQALQFNGETVKSSAAWSLNEHGIYDSHIPESFSYLHFTEKLVD